MANEISVSFGMSVLNGSLSVTIPSSTVRINQSTARGGGPGTVDVGTTEETISFGDIVPGVVSIKNLDDTNYVEFGSATGDYLIRLAAGQTAHYTQAPSKTLYAKANTASVKVQIIAFNS